MWKPKFGAYLSDMVDAPFRGNHDNGSRVASINGEDASTEIVAIGKCRNDHGDISVRVAWCARERDGLECPSREQVNNQAEITPEADSRVNNHHQTVPRS